ncbi:hypothetical protein PpBr36_02538 [Pyricularia pennisetigena]|uniref:hypothetical protein n=1 Tax=Pyricularia pennisetigena TaxID=1578925 RepID=UPI0011525844|nr:hypothetical protein PpBr36_02538 [Pyricularia pennisetigena]TLS31441.1 hypothetical protein PpBr36_02538 [Pyricularia pennisetigena]
MRFSSVTFGLAATIAVASPVTMDPYKAGDNVDPAFAKFVEEWYRISEDKAATTTFSDFFAPGGQLIVAGSVFDTPEKIVAVKQNLLPPNGNKAWWHLIQGSTLVADDTKTQTVSAKIIIQTIYTPGNCSQAHGNAAFTVAKDASGKPNWVPHTGGLKVYNLAVNTVQSPTDEPCSKA